MIWFIVAIGIFVIVGSLIDFSCNGWDITKQFFTDSGWGIIAIISGAIAAILFYGSSKSYKDVKINESFLPNPKKINDKGNSLMAKNKEIVEFDLSKLTLESLSKQMAYEMTKPGPVFFKGWGNRRLELDAERVQIVGRYIQNMIQTGKYLMELQAEALLSIETIEDLVKTKRNQFEINQIEHDNKVRRIQLETDSLEEDVNMKREDVKIKKAERERIENNNIIDKLKAQAKINLLDSKSEIEKARASILLEAMKYLKDLPPVWVSYVISSVSGNNSEIEQDVDLQRDLSETIKKIKDEEVRTFRLKNDEMERNLLDDRKD
jgi:hypothetical protein